jgi:hypothetical protein
VVLDVDRTLVIGGGGFGSSGASAEVLALDGDAGLPAGCCPPITRDVVAGAEFDARGLDVPEGGRVEAVINLLAPSSTDPPVSIRAFIYHSSGGEETVDVPLPAGCSPYGAPEEVTAPEVVAPLPSSEASSETTGPPIDEPAMATCELVFPLPQTDSANLSFLITYVGAPPINADQVSVSFRVADEDDE